MATKKKNPVRRPARPAAAHAAEVEHPANGTEVATITRALPDTRVVIELGVADVAGVAVVRTQRRLQAELDQLVGEIHQVTAETGTRSAELADIFKAAEIDPPFRDACENLVKAAAELGITLTFELAKANFSPEELKYSVSATFRGTLSCTRVYGLAGDRAPQLRDEIAQLRNRHSALTKEARITRDRLEPNQLEREAKAEIVTQVMNQSTEGKAMLETVVSTVENNFAGPSRKQLTSNRI